MGTIVLSFPAVQTRFAEYATNAINKEYGTNINIEKLRISLISWDTSMEGIYIRDYKKDTLFYISELTTSIQSIQNFRKGKLEFGDIDIKELKFKLKTYKDTTSTNLAIFIDKLDDGKERDPSQAPFFFTSSNVEITKGNFKFIDQNREHENLLNFKNLNISGSDLQILGSEVTVGVDSLSFFDKNYDLGIDKLSTNFKYTRQQMHFDSLVIKTPESELKGKLVFNYERKDFKNFLEKVKVVADFNESTIALDEINTIYNQFGKGKKLLFSTSINGVLNDLNLESLFVQTENTGIRGDFNFKNLFSGAESFIMNAKMKNVTTNYYELRSLLPNFLGKLPSSFQKLGQFTLRGDAIVTKSSIDSKVNINTSIGSSYSDLKLTNIDNIDNATYKGFVSLIDFDLGDFVQKKSLGKTSLDFNVEGQGLIWQHLNTEVTGQIYAINFNQYEYKDVRVSGILKDQLFDGSLVSNDQNLKFNFKGLADFGNNRNNFNFSAGVKYADLKKLNFINDSISIFKGDVVMDITGNSIDNIAGDIKFTKMNYQNKNDTYYFEDFKVSSTFENNSIRTIEINSKDIITGYVKGNFKVDELGRLMQNSLGTIYTNYRPFEISSGQTLSFNFKIYNKIIDVFFPEVKFDPNTFIKGNIVADEGDFKLNFKSPSIAAFGNQADSIDVKIDNKNPLFNTYVSVSDLSTNYYDVKDFELINTTLKDTLFFVTEFKGGSDYNDSYNLNFYHTFNEENKSVIGFKKSEIKIKDNAWVVNKKDDNKNKIIVNRTLDSISIQEIVLNNNEEEQIQLRGQLADSTFKDLQLQFKIVSLDKIAPVIDSLNLEGEINGALNIIQREGIYLPTSNLEIKDFKVNNFRLGDLSMGISGNRDLTEFSVNTQISDNAIDVLSVVGKIINKEKTPQVKLLANFRDFALEPFSPLGNGVITGIRGELNGNVKIEGDIENPDFDGIIRMNNAGIAIPYLNVDYSFARNSRVRLDKQTFNFEQISLSDVVENTKATLDGTIKHSFFKNWVLDLNVDTNNDRFLILNTPFEEEVLYYGTGFLNGTGRIYGPTKALNIDVVGSTARGTSLKIPLSDVATVGDYSFINFIDKKTVKTSEEERKLNEYQGLELKFDLDVTPEAEVEIVTDLKTGTSLKGTGEGLLLIEINTNDKFIMNGEFVVVTGEYNYKFGGVINKTFDVVPGGNILWTGDPLAAQLNMEAAYSLYANPAPLLDNSGYTRRIPTDVVIKLTDELESPNIAWDIQFPGTNSIVQSELEYILQDPTVEERNAIFLLAQGSFVNDQTGINQQAVTGNLLQSASSILGDVLSGKNDKLDVGLSYEQGSQDRNTDIDTDSRIGVTVSTKISDRILFNGRVGVPIGGATETVIAGDFEVQVLLNEEGTLSAKFFSRESDIQEFLADRQGTTQGAGISYEVDFNSFKELFRKILGKDKPQKQIPKLKSNSDAILGNEGLIKLEQKTEDPR